MPTPPPTGGAELWLGESKLYADTKKGIIEALKSVKEHLNQGFLKQQKLLIGPQIPKHTPHYHELMELFEPQTSLDKFVTASVFVIGILSNSNACATAKTIDDSYKAALKNEFFVLKESLAKSGLTKNIRVLLLYIPLADKDAFVKAFDTKLKGLQ
ncbi:MAG: DUF1837 domain-containing protein [Rhodopseudomonas sp.]|nr:DUF1837 domain-containing protein [Rhodopseudomonas sp.]